jgi:hypothetical protein
MTESWPDPGGYSVRQEWVAHRRERYDRWVAAIQNTDELIRLYGEQHELVAAARWDEMQLAFDVDGYRP